MKALWEICGWEDKLPFGPPSDKKGNFFKVIFFLQSVHFEGAFVVLSVLLSTMELFLRSVIRNHPSSWVSSAAPAT